jgi:Anti-sigma-28 factor, FlgM
MRILQGVEGTEREMYVKELKERLEHDNYVIDAHLVAEAMLRRVAARRADAPAVTRRGARDRAASAPNRRQQG